jgi:riboflavin kinase/FMN adenylyltransferase
MTLANSYLGYDYYLTGTVFKGKQLGRTIGFPTANIQIEEDYKLIPKKELTSSKALSTIR